jgi:hypothetical protein
MVKVYHFQTAKQKTKKSTTSQITRYTKKIVLTLVTFEVCFSPDDSINQNDKDQGLDK